MFSMLTNLQLEKTLPGDIVPWEYHFTKWFGTPGYHIIGGTKSPWHRPYRLRRPWFNSCLLRPHWQTGLHRSHPIVRSEIVKRGPLWWEGGKSLRRSEVTHFSSYSAGECGICVLFRTRLFVHIFSVIVRIFSYMMVNLVARLRAPALLVVSTQPRRWDN